MTKPKGKAARSLGPKKANVSKRKVATKKPLKKVGLAAKKMAKPQKLASESKELSLESLKETETQEICKNCSKKLTPGDRALYVEEEIGRTFCSEECITVYFSPEIERLEKEYFRRLSSQDLSDEQRDQYAHLRWVTLEQPDEIWREKTLTGDYRYVLVSEFEPDQKTVWCICQCLFLRGEPSFLFLAFVTKNASMVDAYRKGEHVEWAKPKSQVDRSPTQINSNSSSLTDRLADDWSEEEQKRATQWGKRKNTDISPEQFSEFQYCIEETLDLPDEVWRENAEHQRNYFYFLKHYPNAEVPFWYVLISRDTDEEEQIELLEAFPTIDPELLESFRRGDLQVGGISQAAPQSKLLH